MKSKNWFLGLIFLFVGVVALLATLNVFEFDWRIAWRLWPMLFIFIGIAILPVKEWIRALLLVLVLAASVWLYQGEAKREAERSMSGWVNSMRHWWDWIDDDVFDVF